MRSPKIITLLFCFLATSAFANTFEYVWSPGPTTEINPVVGFADVVLDYNTGLVQNATLVDITGNVPLDVTAYMEGGSITPQHITQTGFTVWIGNDAGDGRVINDLLSGRWTYEPAAAPEVFNTSLILIFSVGLLVILRKRLMERCQNLNLSVIDLR